METTSINHSPPTADRTALSYGVGLAVLWVALATWRPTTTFHLAPLLVAGVIPVGATSLKSNRSVALMAAAGIVLALVTTAALAFAGRLDGPSLLPSGGAALESAVGALAGGALGWLATQFIKP